MRQGRLAGVIAIVATVACVSAASAKPRHHHLAKHHHIHKIHHAGRLGYLPRGSSERGRGYVGLVGDPHSGLGFYPLPIHDSVGAWRYHMRRRNTPPWIRNGVLYAMMADSARYDGYWAMTPINSYRYGVYSPFDGVGTPYFGGYYGSSSDGSQPAFPFGRTYAH